VGELAGGPSSFKKANTKRLGFSGPSTERWEERDGPTAAVQDWASAHEEKPQALFLVTHFAEPAGASRGASGKGEGNVKRAEKPGGKKRVYSHLDCGKPERKREARLMEEDSQTVTVAFNKE